jgi:hypothetical protein
MSIQANKTYRVTVEFKPPLSTKRQFQSLCQRLHTDETVLVGLTPQVGIIMMVWRAPSERERTAIKPGALLFKVASGTSGPVSLAVIKSIVADSKTLR